MEDISWLKMLSYLQEFHLLYRKLLPQGAGHQLTTSEIELLSLIYIKKNKCTPMLLSRESGMKKEAVSRTLKQLLEKGLICKEHNRSDDRSRILSLTDEGNSALHSCYNSILKPLYDLKKEMGTDFDALFTLINKANRNDMT